MVLKTISIFDKNNHMNKFFSLLSLLALIEINAQVTLSKTISIDGATRQYRLYIPASYDGTKAFPIVFNFHGYGSNNIEQENYGDFRGIADTANFLLVHPQGLDLGGALGWNTFAPYTVNNYDYTFVSQLLDSLQLKYNTDESRVYATGMSNGGFMSYDLACFMSTRFTAIASVTGSMIASHYKACKPERVMPIMEIHGTNDQTVSYLGNSGSLASTNIDSLVKFWAKLNLCNILPITTNVPDINTADLCTAEHIVYEPGSKNQAVELYRIIDGGHTWPGSPFASPGVTTNQDFKATNEIWRFFSQYSIVNQQGGVGDLSKNFNFITNPVESEIKLTWDKSKEALIQLRDLSGKLVLEKTISLGLNTIECEKLESGMYLYSILQVNESKALFFGKLYKK